MKHQNEYRDPELAKLQLEAIRQTIDGYDGSMTFMEVCGTHTMAIYQHGIRALLPELVQLISGPGCPVCVTPVGFVDQAVALARRPDTIIATFGDMVRVPGSSSSLLHEQARGASIKIVYSPLDAVALAEKNPNSDVVFLGVGFETTAPTIAAAIYSADQMQVDNFSVLAAHKLVPPALEALMATDNVMIDGFILPGHVSVIIGEKAYLPFYNNHQIPCVIAGFEPTDILQAISMLVTQIETGTPQLENAYTRAVTHDGNTKAQKMLEDVFEPADACWRAIGVIPQSGLKIRKKYERHDAEKIFNIEVTGSMDPKGCACGEILTGTKTPPECPLYKTVCTPMDPVGPCMVSTEGTCAAYYKYHF